MSAAVIMMAKTGRLTLTSASFIGLLPRAGRGRRRARRAAAPPRRRPRFVPASPVAHVVPVAS